ncbi:MAG: hypothetical protein ABIF10_02465 [Candidatus Woesearchaeota archaeon]
MLDKVGVAIALFIFLLPSAFGSGAGSSVGIMMATEDFQPMVWLCDHRIVLDDYIEPGRRSAGGTRLVERIENYAFEGEQIAWKVLVMDKNGIGNVGEVYIGISPVGSNAFDKEAECSLDTIVMGKIDLSCNARIHEEQQKYFDPDTMAYYTCIFTVEPPGISSMYGEYYISVIAEDLSGLVCQMAEYWFFNPQIALAIDGVIDFGIARPGTISYSSTVLVGNEADYGSGVLLDMFIAGTDFYDPASSAARCPYTNQLSLDRVRYFAANGAYSTQSMGCGLPVVDLEGYSLIPHGNKLSRAKEIIGCDMYNSGSYNPGNILAPGAEIALTFRLSLPIPCTGSFSDGSIYFWGEAV